MWKALRSLWNEPSVPDPPPPMRRDWVLVGFLFAVALAEGLTRPDLVWRPVAILVGISLLATLPWRRTNPLLVVAIAFGGTAVLDLTTLAAGRDSAGLMAMAAIVVLPYALFRWGSGKEAAIGFLLMTGTHVLNLFTYVGGTTNMLSGFAFLLFPAALGASVRYWMRQRSNEIDQVRLREREQLARELHDSVAHHVSAIAIQAQAGIALSETQPASALSVLGTIEQEAARTLTEMRSIVGVLREGAAAELTPSRTVADLSELAGTVEGRPRVEVHLSGEIETLRPAVDATIYRLAQESVTNALKHSRNASQIEVLVAADEAAVRVVVSDDGERPMFDHRSPTGFGLVGMSERAALLGGTVEAGPGPGQGWTVHAVVPRNGLES